MISAKATATYLALLACVAFAPTAGAQQSTELRVVIIRHGEKPKTGDNLSCQGENRALALAKVLKTKFGRPDFTYVPAMKPPASEYLSPR
jgi:hypothetical protein